MNTPANLFFQSFVKPFYKENAGALVFVFTMMFCIVSTMDGAGMFAYHYSLVTSMLTSPVVFGIVLLLWFLYARKCAMFVSGVMQSPHFAFLHIMNCLSKPRRFWLFLIVELWLLMPILSYSLFILYVGLHQQLYLPVVLVALYLLLLCLVSAIWHIHILQNPSVTGSFSWRKVTGRLAYLSSYPAILVSFIAQKQKAIWIGVKLYTCGVLYLIARNNSAASYDTLMAFLFFNFGIYANGVLVYLVREFEETYLSFYRGLPQSSLQRLGHYVLVYFILLIPEFITILLLTPVHLHYKDAVSFSLCAYSLLLLMNSILFLADFSTKEYAVILLGVFCVQYILLPAGYSFLFPSFFFAAIVLFLWRYHHFERNGQKEAA